MDRKERYDFGTEHYAYGEIERALGTTLGADEKAQKGALRGRLKRIATLGLPPTSPGKGARRLYSRDEALQLLLALLMADAGIDPVLIVPAIKLYGRVWGNELGRPTKHPPTAPHVGGAIAGPGQRNPGAPRNRCGSASCRAPINGLRHTPKHTDTGIVRQRADGDGLGQIRLVLCSQPHCRSHQDADRIARGQVMSVRKREWRTDSGEIKTGWQVDYVDQQGMRRRKLFAPRKPPMPSR